MGSSSSGSIMGTLLPIVAMGTSIMFPPAAPFITAGSAVLGGIMAADAAKKEGQAAGALGDYQRQVAENNAIVAIHNARIAARRTREVVGDEARAGNKFSSRQITQLAANGVVVNSGSALDLVRDADDQTRRNIDRLRQQGVDQQGSFIAQAHNLRQQGQVSQVIGANQQAAGEAKALSTLISTGGQVASQWKGYTTVAGTSTGDIGNILTLSSIHDNPT